MIKDEKVGFEFAPRPARQKKASKEEAPKEKIDFTGQTAIGTCPKCESQVFEGPESFLCERTQADSRRCTFKIGKTILQQPISREQATKLLAEGRTDVLKDFISKAGKPFTAQLVLGGKGKVEFEFPPR